MVFPDVNGKGGQSGGGSPNDLKVKYEEIVKYTHKLTEQKDMVTSEISTLNGQLEGKGGRRRGYALWHILICVIFAVALMKVAEKYHKEVLLKLGIKLK